MLHDAASTGNGELCEFLIEEGAEVDAVDRAGQTALMTAVICDNREVLKEIYQTKFLKCNVVWSCIILIISTLKSTLSSYLDAIFYFVSLVFILC